MAIGAQRRKRIDFSQLRRLFLLIAIALFALCSALLFNAPAQLAPMLTPTPTVAVKVYPTATEAVIRTAWIEARDTCPQSREYKMQVVPGANLWVGEGQTKTPSGKNIRHATRVNVVKESKEWTRIEQSGVTGYVQSFFIVDHDPATDFQPAIGERYDMLCN